MIIYKSKHKKLEYRKSKKHGTWNFYVERDGSTYRMLNAQGAIDHMKRNLPWIRRIVPRIKIVFVLVFHYIQRKF